MTHIISNRLLLSRIHGFILLSRLPFHIVGILPFILGTVLAYHLGYQIKPDILILGILGTVFIMLATYYIGEYSDQNEDNISGGINKSRFSGGSQAIQQGLVTQVDARNAAYISIFLAGCIGILLWLGLGTGPLTIPLGVIGMTGGFLYSARPVRWVSMGLGEIWIAICYGWLPVAVSYYLQADTIPFFVSLISIPVSFSIVAVILINEFPDYMADLNAGKRNLLVRAGLEKGAKIYSLICLATVISAFITGLLFFNEILFVAPFLILGIALSFLVLAGYWRSPKRLEIICACTLILNIGISGALIISTLW